MADKQELIFTVGIDEGDTEKRANTLRASIQQLKKEKLELDKANRRGQISNEEYAASWGAVDKAHKAAQAELKAVQKTLDNNAKVTKAADAALAGLSAGIAKVTGQNGKLAQSEKASTEAAAQQAVSMKEAALATSERNRVVELQVKIDTAAAGSMKQMRAQLSLMTDQYTALSETERKSPFGVGLQKSIKSTSDDLKDLEKKLGDNRRNVGNYLSALDSSFGTFGGKIEVVKSGIESFTTGLEATKLGLTGLRGAIAATGIGLLVLALGAVYQYLTRTQEGLNFVERKMGAVAAVVDLLATKAAAMGKVIFDAFSNPKQALIDLGGAVLDNVINRFKALYEITAGLLTLDFTRIGNGIAQGFTGVEDASGKIGKLTAEAQKAAAAGEAMASANIAIRKAESQLNLERAQSQRNIERLKKLAEDTTKSTKEREAAARQAYALEIGFLNRELALQQRKVAVLESVRKQRKLTDAEEAAINEQKARAAEIEKDSLEKQTELQNTINSIAKEAADASKAAAEAAKAAALEQLQLLATIADKRVEIARLRNQDTLELEKQAIDAAAAVEIAQAKKNAKLILLIQEKAAVDKYKLDVEAAAKATALNAETRQIGLEAQLILVRKGSKEELDLQIALIKEKAKVEKQAIIEASAATEAERINQVTRLGLIDAKARQDIEAQQKAFLDNQLQKQQEAADKSADINQKLSGKIKADLLKRLTDQQLLIDQQLEGVDEGSKKEYDLLKKKLQNERQLALSEANLTNAQLAAINDAFDKKEELLRRKRIAEKVNVIATVAAQANQALSGLIENNIQNQLKNLDRAQEAALKSASLSADQRTRIEAKYQKEREKLEKEAAQKRKIIAQIENVINTARAITAAYAVGGPLGTIFAAIAAAAGIAQGVVIASQQFASGGVAGYSSDRKGAYVTGPGSGTSDSIPARISNGEAIINAKSTKMFYPLLSHINQAGGGRPFPQSPTRIAASIVRAQPGFASGGVATGGDYIDYERLGREVAKANLSLPRPIVTAQEYEPVAKRFNEREKSNDV